jgi:hypothetical protein
MASRRTLPALLASLLLASPAAAGGGDLCFNDSNTSFPTFVFKKPKLPTKPLDAKPLAGVGVTGGAYRSDSGSLSFLLITSALCIIRVGFDDQMVGTASIGCTNGTGDVKTWRPVACPDTR